MRWSAVALVFIASFNARAGDPGAKTQSTPPPESVGDAVHEVKEGAKQVAKGVAEGAKQAAQEVGKAAKQVGRDVSEAAQKAGHDVKEALTGSEKQEKPKN